MSDENKVISVNGRDYAWPKQTAVVVCIDGSINLTKYCCFQLFSLECNLKS